MTEQTSPVDSVSMRRAPDNSTRRWWPSRLLGVTYVSAGVIVVLLHVMSRDRWRSVLWGTHFYAFFPPWFLVVSTLLLLVGILVSSIWRPAARKVGASREIDGVERPRPPITRTLTPVERALVASIVFAGASTLFWLARCRHLLLGDGLPLVVELTRGTSFHPRQPLTYLLQHLFYVGTRGWLAGGNPDPHLAAQSIVSVASSLCGGALVLLSWGLAGEILSPGIPREKPESRRPGTTDRLLVAGLLLSQGFIQLFFGYVENYTWYALGLAAYLWTGLGYARGRVPLVVPLCIFLIDLGLHLSAAVLVPSLFLLVVHGLRSPDRRRRTLRDLGIGCLMAGTLAIGFRALGSGYNWFTTLFRVSAAVILRSDEAPGTYLLSAVHFRDFVNEQLLIGPAGLLFLVPVLLLVLFSGRLRTPGAVFVTGVSLAYAGVSILAGDSNLGYARNWDLLAPAALTFAVAALVLLKSVAPGMLNRRFLGIALMLSLYHTIPWIALNSSADGGVERMKTLPLGAGRSEMAVSTWYMNSGRNDLAREWARRALKANPGNHAAWRNLGLIALREGDDSLTVLAMSQALRMRPDIPDYRSLMLEALIRTRRYEEALPHVQALISLQPGEGRWWSQYGTLLMNLGRFKEAVAPLERAVRIRPDHQEYQKLRDLALKRAHEPQLRVAHAPRDSLVGGER